MSLIPTTAFTVVLGCSTGAGRRRRARDNHHPNTEPSSTSSSPRLCLRTPPERLPGAISPHRRARAAEPRCRAPRRRAREVAEHGAHCVAARALPKDAAVANTLHDTASGTHPRHRSKTTMPPVSNPTPKPQPFSIQMGTPAHLVLAAPSRPRSSSSSNRNPHGVLSTANSDDLADYREHPDAMPVYDLPAPAPPCIRRPAVTKPTGEHPPSQSTYLRMR